MANKILTFGNFSQKSSVQKDTYRDIAMGSDLTKALDGSMTCKVAKNVDVKAVQGALHNIFTWMPGERILNPEFGSRLYTLLYEPITTYTEEQIATEIHRSVTEWEPRAQIVEITNIGTVDDTEDNTIHLRVVFRILGLDDQLYAYEIET